MEKVTKTITIDKETERIVNQRRKKEKRSFSSMCNIILSEEKSNQLLLNNYKTFQGLITRLYEDVRNYKNE